MQSTFFEIINYPHGSRIVFARCADNAAPASATVVADPWCWVDLEFTPRVNTFPPEANDATPETENYSIIDSRSSAVRLGYGNPYDVFLL